MKSLSSQAVEAVGKNNRAAKLTREAKLQHVKHFARFVQDHFALEMIRNLKPGHVQAYVADMKAKGLNAGTMANRMSAVRILCKVIGKANIVERTNAAYGIERNRMNPILANNDRIDQIRSELARLAAQGDRVAMMAHAAAELRYAFGLRAKESLLSSKLVITASGTVLQIEGAKGGRPRELEVRTDAQIRAVQLVSEVSKALGSGTGRIIPPELSLKQAYDKQRYLWNKLGGARKDSSHMHGQRHDRFQEMKREGASNKEIMREAGHGENRSPGHYIPK
jgi:site-specific recombinase XerC